MLGGIRGEATNKTWLYHIGGNAYKKKNQTETNQQQDLKNGKTVD